MRLCMRWLIASIVSLFTFVAFWAICARVAGLDEAKSLGIAGLVAVVVLAPLAWWAPRGDTDEPVPQLNTGTAVTLNDSAHASGVASATNSPMRARDSPRSARNLRR
jgi:hypothetical protein